MIFHGYIYFVFFENETHKTNFLMTKNQECIKYSANNVKYVEKVIQEKIYQRFEEHIRSIKNKKKKNV